MKYIDQAEMTYSLLSERTCKHCGETHLNEVWEQDETGDMYVLCDNHECRKIERWF